MLCVYFVSALQIKIIIKFSLMLVFSTKEIKIDLSSQFVPPYGILQQVSNILCYVDPHFYNFLCNFSSMTVKKIV